MQELEKVGLDGAKVLWLQYEELFRQDNTAVLPLGGPSRTRIRSPLLSPSEKDKVIMKLLFR